MRSLEEFKTPGQYIQSLLEERGWSQRILALILGIDETGLNKIVAGKRPLDANLAISLGSVFGTPPEEFLLLQKTYDLALARVTQRPDPGMMTRAALFGDLPIADMVKRGWLPGVADIRDLARVEVGVQQFFGATSLHGSQIPHAAKKTNADATSSAIQNAWLQRVRQLASQMLVGPFSTDRVDNAIKHLKTHLSSVEGTRVVPKVLADAGIRFVVVEGLPGGKIDGVCTWLDESSPVIGLSLRFDRIDNFWFALRHELEHVRRGDGQVEPIVDADLGTSNAESTEEQLQAESAANSAAASFCIDQDAFSCFLQKKAPTFASRDIVGFARTYHVHPGIVAGQLQKRLDRFDLFRIHVAKFRSSLLPTATYDGWGDVAPTVN